MAKPEMAKPEMANLERLTTAGDALAEAANDLILDALKLPANERNLPLLEPLLNAIFGWNIARAIERAR